jgi:hypothetical protein
MRGDLIRLQGRRLGLCATLSLVVALLGMFVVAAASASAATIGQTDAAANYACAAEIDLQTGVASGTGFIAPSGSWLLTSWSTFAGSAGGSMSLMVFRPTAVADSYTVIAESPLQTLTANVLNTFSAKIVVQGGDLLGFWSGGGAACATFTALAADVNPYSFIAEPPVGATVTTSIALGYRLNISATINSSTDLVANLLVDVTGKGPGTSLADKVRRIQEYVAANDTTSACATLNDFISEVKAQAEKQISAAQATSFTTQANDIKATLGC